MVVVVIVVGYIFLVCACSVAGPASVVVFVVGFWVGGVLRYQIVPRNILTKTCFFGGPGGTKCTPIRSVKQELSYRKIVGFGRYEMSVLVDTSVSCVLFCIENANSYLPKRGFSYLPITRLSNKMYPHQVLKTGTFVPRNCRFW